MTKESKKRPLTFASAEEPIIEQQEDIDALLEGKTEAVEQETRVEPAPADDTPESETPGVADALPAGWNLITKEQQDGRSYVVTHDPSVEGVEAFWRRTRVLSHYRWVYRGRWSHHLSRTDVLPQPVYFRNK